MAEGATDRGEEQSERDRYSSDNSVRQSAAGARGDRTIQFLFGERQAPALRVRRGDLGPLDRPLDEWANGDLLKRCGRPDCCDTRRFWNHSKTKALAAGDG